jgi:N-acetylglucosaminyldiphosphoundecaprenol N-acetyl-beta-D-mannosaminyltransferase
MLVCRRELFGVQLDVLSMADTIRACDALVEKGSFAQHAVINASKVVLMAKDERLRRIIASCEIVNADGQSVVWAAWLSGIPVPERVTGIDLMAQLLERAESRRWPVYFLGATAGVLEAFNAAVRERFPGLVIAGATDGYYTDSAEVANRIGRSGARILFVGMPSPRKEYFIAEQRDRLPACLAVGVGGSFDVFAGHTRRAPRWMQSLGLEWLYRLGQEPRRMWRRYLIGNLHFCFLAAKEIARVRSRRITG